MDIFICLLLRSSILLMYCLIHAHWKSQWMKRTTHNKLHFKQCSVFPFELLLEMFASNFLIRSSVDIILHAPDFSKCRSIILNKMPLIATLVFCVTNKQSIQSHSNPANTQYSLYLRWIHIYINSFHLLHSNIAQSFVVIRDVAVVSLYSTDKHILNQALHDIQFFQHYPQVCWTKVDWNDDGHTKLLLNRRTYTWHKK